jgi:lipopolysaccharide export LptBFGC system permease protein LptF
MLTRFILRELCKTFGIALSALTFLLIGFLLAEAKIEYGLGPSTSMRLVPFVLPRALAYSLSAAWLLSVVIVYGSMSMSNELLAISASGISPLRPLKTAFAFAALLTIPAIWLMDLGNSWGKDGIHRVVFESATDIAYRRLRADKSFSSKYLSVWVKGIEGHELIEPTILFSPSGKVQFSARAEVGTLDLDAHERELVVQLSNGLATTQNDESLRFPDDLTLRIPLRDAIGIDFGQNYTLRQLPAKIESQAQRVQQLEQQNLRQKADLAIAADTKHADDRRELEKQLEGERFNLFRLRCFQHRRISQGFCCFSFTIFGLPLAILLRGRDLTSRFFLSYLPIIMFFYPFEFRLARMSSLPPYTIWACHAVLIVGGIFLLRRVWKR